MNIISITSATQNKTYDNDAINDALAAEPAADVAAFLPISFLSFLLTCFFTCFCVFDKWVIKYKAGLFVPITGFAHSIASSALDYKKDGLITGLGSNLFKLAGSVILYGTISAFLLCVIKVVLYG